MRSCSKPTDSATLLYIYAFTPADVLPFVAQCQQTADPRVPPRAARRRRPEAFPAGNGAFLKGSRGDFHCSALVWGFGGACTYEG